MKRSRSPDEYQLDSPNPENFDITSNTDEVHKVNNRSSETPPAAKITELDPSSISRTSFEMLCSLPPHKEPLVFLSYDEYEAHYRNQHTNRCLACRKNFPSPHLLSLHIEETHDSFVAVKREKGERTYACFVEGCDKVCCDPHRRKMHLIAKHMYPKIFFFGVTRDGIDGRRSLLLEGAGPRRKRSSSSTAAPPIPIPTGLPGKEAQQRYTAAVAPEPGAAEQQHHERSTASTDDRRPENALEAAQKGRDTSPNNNPDVEMEDLSVAISQLQFVPRSVRFGRGGSKSGFAKR